MNDHFFDGARLSQVLIKQPPGFTQLLEDTPERIDVGPVSGGGQIGDLLDLPPDRGEVVVELIQIFLRRSAQPAFSPG